MIVFADPADYAEVFDDGATIELVAGQYPAISHMQVRSGTVMLHLTLWTGRDGWTLHRRLVNGNPVPVRIGECQREDHDTISMLAMEATVIRE
jgi:hypothetical protein